MFLVVAATAREPTKSDVAKLEAKIKRLQRQLDVGFILAGFHFYSSQKDECLPKMVHCKVVKKS